MLNKRAFYGDDWGVPSAEYPAGECLNRSAPGVEDGSYFERAWVNDLMALPGAIMNSAGYTPNGTEDTATASQVFDALVNSRWTPIANYTVGTIITASNGKQYYCNKDSGRDTSPVDPTKDTLDNWREYPAKVTTNSSYYVVEHFDGRVELTFTGTSSNTSGVSTCTIPEGISLKDTNYRPQVSEASTDPIASSVGIFGVIQSSKTVTSFNTICINTDGSVRQNETPQIFISYVKG